MPPPPHNIILFELDFNVEFTLLRLLQFLSDLKSTIVVFSIVLIAMSDSRPCYSCHLGNLQFIGKKIIKKYPHI